jgi:glutathione S-transferase
MTKMLKIWGRKNSVNVQKVLWCAAELGLAFERIDAGLQFGGNDQDWFLALNPNGRVPLIQDGDYTLWESNSIVRYLCAKHDYGGLYPESPERRGDAERWMDWQLSMIARPSSIAFWNLVRKPAADRDMPAVARAVEETNAALTLLDRHLGPRRYVGGGTFSMGDMPVGALTQRWLALEGIERPDWPELRRWHRELCERPAFREHVMQPLS